MGIEAVNIDLREIQVGNAGIRRDRQSLLFAAPISSTLRAQDKRQKCALAPACSISNRARLIAIVSAVSGIPGNPRRVLILPSCITPWFLR